jgi:epoxyqueuosine reductase
MTDPGQTAAYIKALAVELGFDACGIAPAEPLTQEKEHLDNWLAKGYHAGMDYMQKHADKRHDPAQLVENARSVIVFLYNYCPDPNLKWTSDYHISSYAYGADYHDIIREKLNIIIEKLKQEIPGIAIRGFVDSAPVLERAWATRAGLGWIGKNSMLISKSKGSYFFIAELITDLEMEYDIPMGGNYCGDCSRCMDACPTQAITDLRVVDANLCISYHTIENKGDIAPSLEGKFENRIFGCDICQQVCPWNRFSTPHREPAFIPDNEVLELTNQQFETMDKELFNKLFRKSALKRTKFGGLKRNIEFVKAKN